MIEYTFNAYIVCQYDSTYLDPMGIWKQINFDPISGIIYGQLVDVILSLEPWITLQASDVQIERCTLTPSSIEHGHMYN